MEIFRLVGNLIVNNKEANDNIDQTAEKTKNAEGVMTKAFSAIGAAVTTFLSVKAIKDFGQECINSAANAQAMESQFEQVFGDLESTASVSLTAIAENVGVNENRMKGSFTKIAAFAKTTGMDTETSLALSERALIAVADSAAFYDRSLEDTTESLQSFLKGNYENDAALGLSCTEITRNAAANALYGMSFNDLSEAQKQLTLLQMVEDANAASGALGQAARESDTWTNQTGNLKQAWVDFTAMLGEKFLPLAVEIVSKVSEIVSWLTEHETVVLILAVAIGTLTTALIAYNIVQTLATTGMTLATAAGAAFGTVMAFITSPITLVVAAIGALIAIIVLCVKHWDDIKLAASNAWEWIKDTWTSVSTWFDTNVIKPIVGSFREFWSVIKEGFEGIGDAIKQFFANLGDKITLPHFGISPSGWKIADLLKGSIPKLSIEWYAKAMNDPMLMTEPTIFGYNSKTGQLQGGGEAGSEVVSGTNTLMNMIGNVVESKTAAQNERIIVLLTSLLETTVGGNEEMLQALLAGHTLKIGEREFGRLVKEYA